mmetsp:Transcript_14501/g.17635  ORF Transcript_14501/g.17635 Transcript_14501/m.17635 type:complete len:107 (+) Transcript_14501:580-900(+)
MYLFSTKVYGLIHNFSNHMCIKNWSMPLKMAGMTSIYKTTSKWSDDDGSENELYEQEICKLTDFCIDLSWTLFVPKHLYADRAHFYEPVYSWMNLQLLSLIVHNTG